MSVYYAVNNRETEHAVVVTFRNWTEHVLYDTRKTPYDVPCGLEDYPVESVNTDGELTIIEV